MIKEDYEPEELQFVLPEAVKELFPQELDFGEESEKEILEDFNKNFNVMFPENERAERYMDEHEKNTIRREYCKIVEDDLPKAQLNLIEVKEQIKRMKDNAESLLQSVTKQINDYAAKVKEGTKEKMLPATKTMRIALNGYFLYYAMINRKVVLAKAEKIPNYDKSSLWAQEDKNRTAMMELFGLEFPEVEKPTDEEFDREHDLLPDGELDNSDVAGEDEFNSEVGDE